MLTPALAHRRREPRSIPVPAAFDLDWSRSNFRRGRVPGAELSQLERDWRLRLQAFAQPRNLSRSRAVGLSGRSSRE